MFSHRTRINVTFWKRKDHLQTMKYFTLRKGANTTTLVKVRVASKIISKTRQTLKQIKCGNISKPIDSGASSNSDSLTNKLQRSSGNQRIVQAAMRYTLWRKQNRISKTCQIYSVQCNTSILVCPVVMGFL